MNFIEIPICYDCIVKVEYNNIFSYQRMNLSKFREVRSKFSGDISFWILAYNSQSVYTWIKLEDAWQEGFTPCRKIFSNVKGLTFLHAKDNFMPFVSLNAGFFSKDISTMSWALGLYCATNFTFEVKNRYHRARKEETDPKMFFSKRVNHDLDRWFIDNIELRYREYSDPSAIAAEYLENYWTHTIDVYLIHTLLRANVLTPLFFNENLLRPGRCPRDMYWLFQLLYGRDHRIFYQTPTGKEISFEDIRRKPTRKDKNRSYYLAPRIIIGLNNVGVKPIVIHNNLAMRFNNEPTRR